MPQTAVEYCGEMQLGAKVGVGRTSDVYAYGRGAVVKVPQDGTPAHWVELEARSTAAVRRLGLPVPEVKGFAEIDNKTALVFERIDGDSLWNHMVANPAGAPSLARDFVRIHQQIQCAGLPDDVPDLVDRMCLKTKSAAQLSESECEEALVWARRLPRGAALLHGDLHPGNVLMAKTGPVVIDWFDATIGHPVADVVRSEILLRSPVEGSYLEHLPDATNELLAGVRSEYLDGFESLFAKVRPQLPSWQAVVAASRLSEGAEPNESNLIDIWRGRPSAESVSDIERGATSNDFI